MKEYEVGSLPAEMTSFGVMFANKRLHTFMDWRVVLFLFIHVLRRQTTCNAKSIMSLVTKES